MFVHKIDGNIELCLLEERHADQVFSLLKQNLEHLQEELPWLNAEISLNDTKEYIRAGLQRFAANNGIRAGIWFRGELAGIASLHSVSWEDKKSSLGYWLGASHQGQGLVTKACRHLIQYAFGVQKLNRLEIQCGVDNHRSRKVAERLGFTQEGVLRQAWRSQGRFVDLVVYSLLASEWHGIE